KIGNCSSHTQDLVVSSCGQTKLFHGGLEDAHGLGLELAELAELARGHPAIDKWALVAEALGLADTRLQHLGAEVRGGGAGGHLGELGEGDGGNPDVQVDAVKQRAGDLAEVLLDL